jgi:hypothetical protein
MIFPNIQIITNNQNVYFSNDDVIKLTTRYQYLKDYYNLDKDTAVIILSQILPRYKSVINYIKEKKICNVYFFIDDCFRSNLNNSFVSWNSKFFELAIIIKIIKKSDITKHRIFHCEIYSNQVKGLNLEYADLFLTHWIKFPKYTLFKKFKKFNYKASCLNNRQDIHRHLIGAFLCKNKDVFLTLNNYMLNKDIFNNNAIYLDECNYNLKTVILNNLEYLNKNKTNYLDTENKKESMLSPARQHNRFAYKAIQNSFLNIVTETTFTTNSFFITEKTIKPIQCFRPFVILSTPGTIKQLKHFGFKTFSNWWDESYDNETDHTKRFQKICILLEEILSKSDDELKTILKEMSEVLDHNYNNLPNLTKFLLPKI